MQPTTGCEKCDWRGRYYETPVLPWRVEGSDSGRTQTGLILKRCPHCSGRGTWMADRQNG